MKIRKVGLALIAFFCVSLHTVFSQSNSSQINDTTAIPKDWFLRDPQADRLQGISVDKAYTFLQGRPSRTIIVAVVDSGVDIDHEDLKDIIWTNEDEIAGNGIDDDKNGYVDDIHGWNFIGGKSGNVKNDTYEVTREYARLRPKYENIDENKIGKKNSAEYALYLKVKTKYEHGLKSNKEQFDQYNQQYQLYLNAYGTLAACDSLIQLKTGKPVNRATLASVEATNDTVRFAKQTLMKVMESVEGDVTVTEFLVELADYLKQLKEGVDHYGTAVQYGYNLDYNPRDIVGDDPNNVREKNYGNNDVIGPYARHGTHVAGIIAANRQNNIGVRGVADNVRIMPVRVIPNGDERDKDVANGIRYAVDNGAKVINMSFGKKFSPNKDVVDEAVRYAESKGVLLIHAAGNDGDDLDKEPNFPTRTLTKGGVSKTWLEIGASSWGADENFVGSFSNYGKKSVDLFAPGVEIYSTVPGNAYEDLQGTSMACPAASGVAAILFSYFPDLTADQVKNIMNQSTRKFDGLKVTKPGTADDVNFSQLSISGGLVNAYEAVKLADSMKAQLKNK